jgi:DNA-binding response OmpR family regulator
VVEDGIKRRRAAPHDCLIEAQELGTDVYLRKPFDLDVLTKTVQSFLRSRSA